ncbi:hypothetical protein ML462_14820 [Gramella lutea]|uniref:Uncharacterized protein n=1 Tax=Christiangramia lutea TaxID=1607951 RepID=A0A9X2ACT3_9FLAO|nr:hypothetical protein [Christiangramia lutea]MCH4824443.1 hypothetical protein [Christiangramia lutea]
MKEKQENWKSRSGKNTLKLGIWTGSWVLTTALVAFGPDFIWNENRTLTLMALILNLVIGLLMILANKNYVNSLDELQRKIQLEAMGMALGVAVVFGIGYSMLDTTNIITHDAEISHLIILIALTYFAGCVIGSLRYR